MESVERVGVLGAIPLLLLLLLLRKDTVEGVERVGALGAEVDDEVVPRVPLL